METIDQIYQKVVEMELPPGAHAEVNELIATALRAGATWALPTDPLAGYSNLTAAIKAGEPIDWAKLDGLKAQCVHPELGMLTKKVERDGPYTIDSWEGWVIYKPGDVWLSAFQDAWRGENGWTLWVEGEVPLRCKTADQLEVGTYFLGQAGVIKGTMYVGKSGKDHAKSIHYTPSMTAVRIPISAWVVLEEYGTFQTPEGK